MTWSSVEGRKGLHRPVGVVYKESCIWSHTTGTSNLRSPSFSMFDVRRFVERSWHDLQGPWPNWSLLCHHEKKEKDFSTNTRTWLLLKLLEFYSVRFFKYYWFTVICLIFLFKDQWRSSRGSLGRVINLFTIHFLFYIYKYNEKNMLDTMSRDFSTTLFSSYFRLSTILIFHLLSLGITLLLDSLLGGRVTFW